MNDSTQLNGRRLFVWRGKDPIEDERRLTETIAEVCAGELFDANGLVWFNEGQAVPATGPVLRELLSERIAGVRLVSRGRFGLAVEYFSYGFAPEANIRHEPNDQVLLRVIENLLPLVARGPTQPVQLTKQREQEIRTRLKQREPARDVAAYYGISIDEVKRLGQN